MIIGYTAGVFDLFHVGHVNLLRGARAMCDRLIVAVSTDQLATYKGKVPVIPFADRAAVVRSCRFVDAVVPQDDLDKVSAWEQFRFDVLVVGDDWRGTKQWESYEVALRARGARVEFLPYTQGVSSTLINSTLERLRSQQLGAEG